jgi:hypothetical protein
MDEVLKWILGIIQHCGDGSLHTILFEIKGGKTVASDVSTYQTQRFGYTF